MKELRLAEKGCALAYGSESCRLAGESFVPWSPLPFLR